MIRASEWVDNQGQWAFSHKGISTRSNARFAVNFKRQTAKKGDSSAFLDPANLGVLLLAAE
jgi:hypothetical protein